MYCRKCGTQLSDDSEYCVKCGTKVIKLVDDKNETTDVQTTKTPDSTEKETTDVYTTETPENTEEKFKRKQRKKPLRIDLLIAVPAIILIVAAVIYVAIVDEVTCMKDFCFKPCVDGANVCYEHMCEYPGCNRMKDTKEIYSVEQIMPYCIVHICCERNCTEMIDEGVFFCRYHKCIVEDCTECRMSGSKYCSSHANEW